MIFRDNNFNLFKTVSIVSLTVSKTPLFMSR